MKLKIILCLIVATSLSLIFSLSHCSVTPEIEASSSHVSKSGVAYEDIERDNTNYVVIADTDSTDIISLSDLQDKRLRFDPTASSLPSRKVVDICDDTQAITLFASGSDVYERRQALGVDCDTGTLRYVAVNGNERTSHNSIESAERYLSKNSSSNTVHIPLGYMGVYYDDYAFNRDEAVPLKVISESIKLENGYIRGIFANTSLSIARNIVVNVNGIEATYPLTVLPGEVAPFSVESDGSLQLENVVSVRGNHSEEIDESRYVLVTGTPGYGPLHYAPENIIDLSSVSESSRYFETGLEIEGNNELQSIESVRVIVALLNQEKQVLDVIDPKTFIISESGYSEATTITRSSILMTGFIVPEEATDFSIWAGGDN